MQQEAAVSSPPGPGAPPPPQSDPPRPAAREPLLQVLAGLWRDLPGLLGDRIELLSLELQRASLALVQIVMLVVGVAILGVTAWLVLWVGIVSALAALGLHLAWALLLALALNGVAAALAVARVRRLLPLLRLPATRRHLMPRPSPEPPEPRTPNEHTASPAAGHAVAP